MINQKGEHAMTSQFDETKAKIDQTVAETGEKLKAQSQKFAGDVSQAFHDAEDSVLKGYDTIEKSAVESYDKIEKSAVEVYDKMENQFVDDFLTKDGESVDDAKARLAKENADRKAEQQAKLDEIKTDIQNKTGLSD